MRPPTPKRSLGLQAARVGAGDEDPPARDLKARIYRLPRVRARRARYPRDGPGWVRAVRARGRGRRRGDARADSCLARCAGQARVRVRPSLDAPPPRRGVPLPGMRLGGHPARTACRDGEDAKDDGKRYRRRREMERVAALILGTFFAVVLATATGLAAPVKAGSETLPSAMEVDRGAKTATFPLFKGTTPDGDRKSVV